MVCDSAVIWPITPPIESAPWIVPCKTPTFSIIAFDTLPKTPPMMDDPTTSISLALEGNPERLLKINKKYEIIIKKKKTVNIEIYPNCDNL